MFELHFPWVHKVLLGCKAVLWNYPRKSYVAWIIWKHCLAGLCSSSPQNHKNWSCCFFLVRLFVVFGWCIKVHLSFVYSKGDHRLWSISYLGIAKRWIWHICIRYKWWNVSFFTSLTHPYTRPPRHTCMHRIAFVRTCTYLPTDLRTYIYASLHASMQACMHTY